MSYRITLISTDQPEARNEHNELVPTPAGPVAHRLFLALALSVGRPIQPRDLKAAGWPYEDPAVDVDDWVTDQTLTVNLGRIRAAVPVTKRTRGNEFHRVELQRSDVDVLDFIDRVPTATTLAELNALLGMWRYDPRHAVHNLPAMWWAPLDRALTTLFTKIGALTDIDRASLDSYQDFLNRFPNLWATDTTGTADETMATVAAKDLRPITHTVHPAPDVQGALANLGIDHLDATNTTLIGDPTSPGTLTALSVVTARLATAKGAIVIYL